VAGKHPEKLRQLQALFDREAKRNQVYPLDTSVATRLVSPRPSLAAGRNVFTWTAPMIGTPYGDAPSILNASYTFKAEIEVPAGGAEGMLITTGGRFAGYGFYLLKGKPVFNWNLVGLKWVRWEGPEPLAPGKHVLEFDFKYDGMGAATLAFNNLSGIGRSGTGVLRVDGKEVVRQAMERTVPLILAWDENLDVGSDTGTPVDDRDYQVPFPFTGKIKKITLTVDRPQLTPADVKMLEQAQRNNRASE
jgi:arylsulfatase